MRFCSSPGWLIISFGFFRLSFLGGLKQLQPRSSSSSSSSSSHPPHHHHHQAILIIKPSSSSSSSLSRGHFSHRNFRVFFSNQKSDPTSNSSCRFFEVRGWGDVTCTTKTNKQKPMVSNTKNTKVFRKTNIWVFPKIMGTPKSSILIGFSIINHPILGYRYFWKHPYVPPEKKTRLELTRWQFAPRKPKFQQITSKKMVDDLPWDRIRTKISPPPRKKQQQQKSN